jgi:hypothetical protein
VHTELRLPRRKRGQNGAHTSRDIVEAVRILARVCSDDWGLPRRSIAPACTPVGEIIGHENASSRCEPIMKSPVTKRTGANRRDG